MIVSMNGGSSYDLCKNEKKLISCLAILAISVMGAMTAFAANNVDTGFQFNFSAGQPRRTEWRAKKDSSNVYMSVQGLTGGFTAHVVGSSSNLNSGMGIDCSRGYTYNIASTGVYRMRNWVYDGAPGYGYAAVYASPNYGYGYSAWGVWSPDSI